MNKNISIITNWGCHANCWYCVWKTHPLKNICPPTDWRELNNFLCQYAVDGIDKVSISGGGDCLYKYEDHKEWWDKLFNICNKFEMRVDVHSRYKFYNSDFWKNINRVVVSSDNFYDDLQYFAWIIKYVKLRIVHVATDKSTLQQIKLYKEWCNKNNCQFTVKELVGFDDGGMYIKIKENFPDIFMLDSGDYNIYYMPDNSIRTKFLY
jgi:hypothetical protein